MFKTPKRKSLYLTWLSTDPQKYISPFSHIMKFSCQEHAVIMVHVFKNLLGTLDMVWKKNVKVLKIHDRLKNRKKQKLEGNNVLRQ